jgi:hypothetical protein
MLRTVMRDFFRSARSRHESSRGSAARRRLKRRPELDTLEVRLTLSSAVDYTNLAVSGAVVLPPPSPVHDVKIAFSATPGSSFTLNEAAHDVTIVGNIPAGDTVTLNGDVSNVTIQGDVLGKFVMTKNGNDVRMGDVHGTVIIGPSSATSIHDFTAGEIFAGATFTVLDTFHDGTLGPVDAGSTVVITGPHHKLTVRS